MKTPVIATAHGGSLETVRDGETGWLVPPGDIAALANAISAGLADPARARMIGEAARRHVLENFTTIRTLAAERSAYARAISGKDRRP
ncbi:glycosyltransferase [Aquibium sp. ELW1220]|uniref:glycosyltransferase n=1 Tax=Aquibium sp. ELW1220 TaxID=2976766 RepID=UPI0025B12099|nr:glycosyltransferase [Aquibium sp. ELW1220]MDN2584278.1 glycosyltransferase [Aquibium sp. ELW1220]